MYLKMKVKVIRICELCILFAMNCFVLGLGALVLSAIGFVLYQTITGQY